jgi:hypothetical protein
MALSAFDDKSAPPRDDELAKVLGRTSGHWDKLRAAIAARFEPLTETWKFSGKQWGWTLQLKQKKRAVLYMTPRRRYFAVGFALGEKAVKAARQSGVPAAVLKIIDDAPKYAEGRGVRLEVRTKKDVDIVEQIAAIKMAN